jgi:L-lactate permease
MHPAIQGALVGLGIGVFLLVFEYLALSKGVNERAKKYNKKPEFDVTERRRLATIRNFVPILIVGFAIGFWIIWG